MRISPLFLSIIYILMGSGFIYIAVLSKTDTIWRLPTIIFTIVATLNIGVGLRLFMTHLKLSQKKDE